MKCDLPTQRSRRPRRRCGLRYRVVAMVDPVEIGGEEPADVLVEFLRDDELLKLLPHRGRVELIRLHNAVDRPGDVAFEQVLNQHTASSRNQLEAR